MSEQGQGGKEEGADESETEQPPQQRSGSLSGENIHVELTSTPLSIQQVMDKVRSPKAGALVLFAGTTRDSFNDKPVAHLSYTAYTPLALTTMMAISKEVLQKHGLIAICIVHRVGEVPIGEESVLVAVAGRHRGEAWRGGEEALEMVKGRVEVWKREVFVRGGGVWRSNRPGCVAGSGGDEGGGEEGG